MTREEQFAHDMQTNGILQQRQGMSDIALVHQALADLLLFCGAGSKYNLPPTTAATFVELMARAQPATRT